MLDILIVYRCMLHVVQLIAVDLRLVSASKLTCKGKVDTPDEQDSDLGGVGGSPSPLVSLWHSCSLHATHLFANYYCMFQQQQQVHQCLLRCKTIMHSRESLTHAVDCGSG